ncbi:MAG: MotA/TolQ/ExbB proton channel family protein [Phycisphaerae bacterium]|nr:MotA/TolQ/ExbB proton channel family protein [Phycisphaerae bacterium]
MDIATIIGVIFSIGALIWAMYEGTHGHLEAFYSTEGFVLVLGGSFAAVCLSMPLRSVLEVGGYLKNWLFAKETPIHVIIQQIVHYAEIARREGVLALETEVQKQQDPFMKKGLQLCVDSMDAAVIEKSMRIEIEALAERHKKGKKFFELMGKYGPGFGLTATLIGQVAMFRNMGGDSAAIGQALAIALLGTLYGCIICNVVCGPIADKLAIRSADEQFVREMILVGILGLQTGDNPRMVQIKMQSFLSAREQRALLAESEKKG